MYEEFVLHGLGYNKKNSCCLGIKYSYGRTFGSYDIIYSTYVVHNH